MNSKRPLISSNTVIIAGNVHPTVMIAGMALWSAGLPLDFSERKGASEEERSEGEFCEGFLGSKVRRRLALQTLQL